MDGTGVSSKSVESGYVVEETPPGLLAKQGEGEGRTVRARDEQTVIQNYPDSSPPYKLLSDPIEAKPTRVDGVVKLFDHETGYGIIFPSVGDDILWVHRSSIRDGRRFGLVEGESVEFLVECTENGIIPVDVTGPMESLTQGAIRGGDGYPFNEGVIGGYVLWDDEYQGGDNGGRFGHGEWGNVPLSVIRGWDNGYGSEDDDPSPVIKVTSVAATAAAAAVGAAAAATAALLCKILGGAFRRRMHLRN